MNDTAELIILSICLAIFLMAACVATREIIRKITRKKGTS